MKIIITTFYSLFFFCADGNAQSVIAVLSGNNWSFYENFPAALGGAENESVIYLPGGTFTVNDFGPDSTNTINKTLHIIGVGHYPDSTISTGKTVILGKLFFAGGSNNSILEGVEITNGIFAFPSTGGANIVNNLIIKRCKTGQIDTHDNSTSYFSNLSIKECVTGVITGGYIYQGLVVSNCIIGSNSSGNFVQHLGAIFRNNVIISTIGGSWFSGYRFSYCTFENNIIRSFLMTNVNDCIFRNNIFFSNSLSTCPSCMEFENNYFSNASDTFIYFPDATFNYSYNFNLIQSSVGVNAGTDGNDIGIYGTEYPYKPGAVPANPHISLKSVSPSSNSNGTLPVTFRVIAQDR